MADAEHRAAEREARRLVPGMTRGSTSELRAELLVKYLRAAGSTEHRRAAAPHGAAAPAGSWPATAAPPVLRVRDIMQRPAAAFTADAVFLDMARAFTREPLSAVPVVDAEQQVVGVVSETDLLARAAGGRPHADRRNPLRRHGRDRRAGETARDLMSAPAICVHPDTPVADAAVTAARNRLKRMPVTDHRGRLVGVVRRTDLLQALVRDDAALRAEIENEVLAKEFGLDAEQVQVRVVNGTVTLTGRLAPAAVPGLMAAIRRIDDVAAVVDHLSAAPER